MEPTNCARNSSKGLKPHRKDRHKKFLFSPSPCTAFSNEPHDLQENLRSRHSSGNLFTREVLQLRIDRNDAIAGKKEPGGAAVQCHIQDPAVSRPLHEAPFLHETYRRDVAMTRWQTAVQIPSSQNSNARRQHVFPYKRVPGVTI